MTHIEGLPACLAQSLHIKCFPTGFLPHCKALYYMVLQCNFGLHLFTMAIEARQRLQCCRDVADRALRVLCKEAEKYSEVRSRLATLEGLQAAALFQQGLKQHSQAIQSPTPAGLDPKAIRLYSIPELKCASSNTCSGYCSFLLCCQWQHA